ncbi:monovalent cation/H+ antiporter complex subunit F [Luteimicrobium subarcticum]|uniref:Multicomponent Na+:H+ antiporter subunit F n=1 Tax=Luteimicrobium subarcticum TaxID=620910 RepID=A0A2M8WS35_9MICO|nr:monovalent cation/H+ antiporter complex subunit F [Luteimicrobium subarcticum]PJI93743.1 multicomponent Na+:H+ antiporter subunit F [Luteimicrobium subarcticum]
MTWVYVVAGAMLVVAAACAVWRAERGPSMLDRTVALDVFTTTLVAAIAVEAAWSRRTTTLPILVVMSLVAFVGSVTVARFAAVDREEDRRVQTPQEAAAEEARRRAAEERAGRGDDDGDDGMEVDA